MIESEEGTENQQSASDQELSPRKTESSGTESDQEELEGQNAAVYVSFYSLERI